MKYRKWLLLAAQITIAFQVSGQFRWQHNLLFWKDTISANDFGVKIAAPSIATGISANVVTDFFKRTRMQFQLGMIYAGNDTSLWIYNLFNGHGNASLNFMRPIYVNRIKNSPNYIMTALYNRNSALLPGQSGSSNRLLGSVESGLSIMGHLVGENDAIKLTGEYRLGGSWHNLISSIEQVRPRQWYLAHMLQLKVESQNTSLSFSFPLGISGFKYKLPFFFGFSQQI